VFYNVAVDLALIEFIYDLFFLCHFSTLPQLVAALNFLTVDEEVEVCQLH
jgi:hypothetical protein